MDDELGNLLNELEASAAFRTAAQGPLSRYESASDIGAVLKSLHMEKEHGVLRVTARNIPNVLLNWKALLWRLAGNAGSGWAAFHSGHIGAEILFALKLAKELIEVGTITLSEDQAKVVFALWIMNAEHSVVPVRELERLIADKIKADQLPEILFDLERLRLICVDQETKEIQKTNVLFLE